MRPKTKNLPIHDKHNAYRQILDLFVGDDKKRSVMMQPFIQEDFVCATNAHALICFKKDLLSGIDFESHEKAPNALAVIPIGCNIDIEFDTQKLREEIIKSKKIAEETYSVVPGKCPDCNGGGWVHYEFIDYRGRTNEIAHECPTCIIDDDWTTVINKKTGDQIEEFRELFEIKGAFFDVKYFEKLVRVAELLSISKFYLIYRNSTTFGHKFKIGNCIILLMSVMQATDDDLVTNIA